MKLSRRGIRGVGYAYGVIFIGIGIGLLLKENPKVWGTIFGILGLILATICSYGLGKTYDTLKGSSRQPRPGK